jgi:hypothetical protein
VCSILAVVIGEIIDHCPVTGSKISALASGVARFSQESIPPVTNTRPSANLVAQ